MPYEIVHVKDGDHYGVRNAESGEWKSKDTTHAEAEKQIRLLHGVEHGWKPGNE